MLLALALLIPLTQVGTTDAALISTFRLNDSSDGSEKPPTYGLRLDGLNGDNSSEWTFSFDQPGTKMFLDLHDNGGSLSVRIHGTAYGGEDVGPAWGNQFGLVEIDFTYTQNVNAPYNPGDHYIRVTADDPLNSGTIKILTDDSGNGFQEIAQNTVVNLVDKANGTGPNDYSFEFDDDGHRNGQPFSGRGWLNHSVGGLGTHINASDWLFEGSPVPEPGSFAVWGLLCLAGIGELYRRRSTK